MSIGEKSLLGSALRPRGQVVVADSLGAPRLGQDDARTLDRGAQRRRLHRPFRCARRGERCSSRDRRGPEKPAAARRRTILFIDEIHRFNKAQQDALLGAVEDGTITLIGATTENPSFEVNAALLSRCRVVVLEPLPPDDLATILRGTGRPGTRARPCEPATSTPRSIEKLARWSGGDARVALSALEDAVAATTRRDGWQPARHGSGSGRGARPRTIRI